MSCQGTSIWLPPCPVHYRLHNQTIFRPGIGPDIAIVIISWAFRNISLRLSPRACKRTRTGSLECVRASSPCSQKLVLAIRVVDSGRNAIPPCADGLPAVAGEGAGDVRLNVRGGMWTNPTESHAAVKRRSLVSRSRVAVLATLLRWGENHNWVSFQRSWL